MSERIEFVATIAKVQTLVDGGIRLTLDLPEHETLVMAQMAEMKRLHGVMRFYAEPEGSRTQVETHSRFDD